MTDAQIEFSVFYSWQSDLPDNTNRQAIRSALRAASSIVEEENSGIRLILDEATRGESGSPNIPATILDKIRSSDAFVCDITTINTSAPEDLRRTPNPNVIFELGYAVAHLGWGRIVMLFNEDMGEFPKDTPFDIDRHRASPYSLSLNDPKNKSNRNKLNSLVTESIQAIVKNQPQRPFELLQKTPNEVKRLRDLENIRWAMNTIHVPTVDDMVLNLPHHLNSKALHFWESFNGVVTSSLFHIYDEELREVILSVHKSWHGCVSHGEQYHMASNPNLYVFANPGNAPFDNEQEREWSEIQSASTLLRELLDTLLKIIRERYLEIDIDETNKNAWVEYVEFQKEMDEKLER